MKQNTNRLVYGYFLYTVVIICSLISLTYMVGNEMKTAFLLMSFGFFGMALAHLEQWLHKYNESKGEANVRMDFVFNALEFAAGIYALFLHITF